MASLPFALSVHHFISSVGADAGFASLIGLALLVLLYFAHARETATLRSRADDAGLRVQELEMQLADLADQVAALPAEISVRAAGPRVAAASGGVAQRAVGAPVGGYAPLAPAAPAGMAAPALAAATRLIPMPEVPVAEPEPEPETMHDGANGAARVPVAASAGTVQRPVQTPAGGAPRPPAGPGRAVGGGGGNPNRPNGGQARPTGGQRPPSRAGGYQNSGGRPMVPVRPAPKRSRIGRVILALAVALIGAAVIAGVFVVLNNRGKSHKPAKSQTAIGVPRRTNSRSVLVKPANVTVSVLNGTDQNGLALSVSNQLVAKGFRKGAITNAANQTQTTSIVGYSAPAYRADAIAVADTLKLRQTSVQLVNSSTKTIACSNSPLGCSSLVYVTAGSDLSAQ